MNPTAFPQTFLWGAATAAHQVEGNNVATESWVLEHLPDTIYAEPAGDACDHYHRYPEDIALLAGLGFNAYRFSLDWARIEPAEGEFSAAALEHYRRMIGACHDQGLAPVVTLHHFTSPQWLIRKGGWVGKDTPAFYERYCEKASRLLGDVAAVCTFNELNLAAILAYMLPFKIHETPFWKNAAAAFGVTPDQLGLFQFTGSARIRDTVMDSHRRGVAALKAGGVKAPVGMTLALMDIHAAPGGEARAAEVRREVSDVYLEALKGDDFVGVQTYSRWVVGPDGIQKPGPGAEVNQMGEEFYPEAIGGTVRHAARVAGIPVIVTENGVAAEDDSRRVEYFQRAVKAVAGGLADGVDIRGYFAWSLMDNFEWVGGYKPKFGIIGVDRATQTRTVKPSARWLGEVARRNGL